MLIAGSTSLGGTVGAMGRTTFSVVGMDVALDALVVALHTTITTTIITTTLKLLKLPIYSVVHYTQSVTLQRHILKVLQLYKLIGRVVQLYI